MQHIKDCISKIPAIMDSTDIVANKAVAANIAKRERNPVASMEPTIISPNPKANEVRGDEGE